MNREKVEGFQDLKVWKEAHKLVLEIYKITKKFPENERFRIIDQLCRSAVSIAANIAEGKGRNTLKEYIQFLYNARGSLEETKYHLILSEDLGYINENKFEELIAGYDQVGKMLNGLINSLKTRRE